MSATTGPTLPEGSTPLMNTERLSLYLGISAPTLERLRCTGDGPPYLKLGAGRTSRVIYDKRDVDAWLASKRRTSTDDRGRP